VRQFLHDHKLRAAVNRHQALVGFIACLVIVGFTIGYVARESAHTKHALCALRGDLQQRIDSSTRFLVYNPARLVVQHKCAQIEGTITHVSKERDGDLHIRMSTDPKWLTPANTARQHGDLVVEYMPSDSYPKPLVGDRLRLLCTHVIDRQHGGWAECHPVWRVQPLGSAAQRPIP
jgi:hypothetical protein